MHFFRTTDGYLVDLMARRALMLIASVALVAGCGSAADIAAGQYRVVFTTVEDTCGFTPEAKDVDIEEDEEAIRVVFIDDGGGRTTYTGRREGGKIVASLNFVRDGSFDEIEAQLTLKARGDGFRGTLEANIYLASGAVCRQVHQLDGTLR